MEQVNTVLALNSASPAFPVELLREVILVYLADCFMDIIAEPSVEKNWDPLSSLLRTSSQFRGITAELLGAMFGDVSFLAPTESSILNYVSVLARLKRLHTVSYTEPVEPTPTPTGAPFAIGSAYSSQNCPSPLIAIALESTVTMLHYRVYKLSAGEPLSNVAGQAFVDRIPAQALPPPINILPSVSRQILAPITKRTMSFTHLVQRIFILHAACDLALQITPDDWSIKSRMHRNEIGWLRNISSVRAKEVLDELQARGISIDELPIPLHIMQTTKARAALLKLESSAPGGHLQAKFCKALRATILDNFYPEQRDALQAEPIALRTRMGDAMSNARDDHESATADP